jgi:hypothetical protein
MAVKQKYLLRCVAIGLVALIACFWVGGALAQPDKRRPGTVIKPTGVATSVEAEERTEEAIEKDQAAFALMPQRPFNKPFMPTMSRANYDAAKRAAEQARRVSRSTVSGPQPLAPPVLIGPNFNGVSETASCGAFLCAPPDTHGAVGPKNFVAVTNYRVSVYNKGGGLIKRTSLNAFFGVSLLFEQLFDPRVVYDRTWNRFIIVATRISFSAADTDQYFYLAVSKTGNPAGAYWKYIVFFGDGVIDNGDYWDYPQLGMDQDSVILTGNIFESPSGAFKGAAMMPVAKARVYNGLGFSVPLFDSLPGTLAPPIVLDQNAGTFLVAAEPNDSDLDLFIGENLSQPAAATLTLQSNIAVAAYTTPPNALQPGTASTLDTLDGRFVNASTQIGNSLWNVHTINIGGFAVPRFYKINTASNTIRQSGTFFATATSDDFNASIAANDDNDAFVTWSATDTGVPSSQAQVRFSGRQEAFDALGSMNSPGTAMFTSPTFYNGFDCPSCRWGDYSAVTIDPQTYGACAAGQRAWIVNQRINSQSLWGTRIGRIGFC